MKSSLSRNSTRHPAVIDTLGGAPLPSSAGGPPKPPKSAKAPKPAKSPTAPKAPRPQKDENSGNSHVLRYVAGALVVVSLLGWFLIGHSPARKHLLPLWQLTVPPNRRPRRHSR